MKKVKNVVIGFGEGGKNLAIDLGKRGEETLLIEKDPKMYGGTCTNVACIPAKHLLNQAENRKDEDPVNYYQKSIQSKNKLVAELNASSYEMVNQTENVQVIDGQARFVDNHTIQVGEEQFVSERIFIDTGSQPNILPIEGLEIGGNIYTSETLLEEDELPKKLAILGDGKIGLEFAHIYQQFGSHVTVICHSDQKRFLSHADPDMDVAQLVLEDLQEAGIDFLFEAETSRIDLPEISFEDGRTLTADALLVATGRHPYTEGLGLENTDVTLNQRRGIDVNDHLQTKVPHIYALGDVRGDLQQSYLSLDDYRIIRSHLFEGGKYRLSDRQLIPYTTFLAAPISRVGHNETSAQRAGINYTLHTLKVADIPKAKVLGKTKGIFKVLINPENDQILGATLYGAESHEIINIVGLAIAGELPASLLRNHIFTHPTLAESFNDIF